MEQLCGLYTTQQVHTALHTGERGSGCDLSNKKIYDVIELNRHVTFRDVGFPQK